MSEFSTVLKFGQEGENLIANWLRNRGWNVLPVYEKEGGDYKGPRLFTPTDGLIAPDLWAIREAQGTWKMELTWIEAKHKAGFDYHRITGDLVTGIDERHYLDYLKIADLTRKSMDFFILFLQRGIGTKNSRFPTPAGLYGKSIHHLRKNEHHRHSGMVYWDESAFEKMAELDDLHIVYRENQTASMLYRQ